MLTVLHTFRLLRLTRPGRLLPWLGPALRGLLGHRLRDWVCRCDTADGANKVLHREGCAYGETLEATPKTPVATVRGQEDGFRPLVIAPVFPAPSRGVRGLEVPVRISFIGESAARWAGVVWSALDAAGRDPAAGFDPDRTTFEIAPLMDDRLVQMNLPLRPEAVAGAAPRLRVDLTAPLFLREEHERGKHRLIEAPTFADLFRASLRVLGGMNALYARPLDADFGGLKALAEQVPAGKSDYRGFRQPRHSNRTGHRGVLRGAVGWGEYRDVPLSLVPWLVWGGAVHAGPHRVAGAGGWDVKV